MSTSNTTSESAGLCPPPFLAASTFGASGGYIPGRFCAPATPNSPVCCLPCPATQWIYPDSFDTANKIAEWLNVFGFILLVFLLLSYIVLPTAKTNRHYLNICLIVSCMFICLGFIVPLAAKVDQCFDAITPNDMYSSTSCAWSGAFIVAGGLSASTWIFLRSMSMFLQIVWGIEPGKKSFYVYQLVGWACPAALLTAALTVTGVSFRFGNACHINHDNSMADFWGWILALAGLTIITQLFTMAYCLKVYLTNLFSSYKEDQEDPENVSPASFNEKTATSSARSGSPSSNGKDKKASAREIYEQVKTVLHVQWRILVLVFSMLVYVIFFSIVFVYLDDSTAGVLKNFAEAEPWLLCLINSKGDKTKCLSLTRHWMVSEITIGAVLILLSLIAASVFVLLFRWTILAGWREWIAQHITHRRRPVTLGHMPKITHRGLQSPSDSIHSRAPLTAGAAAAGYYDMSELTPSSRDEPGPGRFWHPNPSVQAAQREGIMRSLRAARARARSNNTSPATSRHDAEGHGQGNLDSPRSSPPSVAHELSHHDSVIKEKDMSMDPSDRI